MAGIQAVHLSSDTYMVCLSHAFSTEKEEIMGLLIGEIDERRVCQISALIMLRRSDKQPDRVEISPEQLSAASTHAETLARNLKRPMRVVGWYHSHPRITVWPSHVDVQTQAMYQMMDEGFVGIIFSVFNEDKAKQNRMQVTCFQSINQSPEGQPPQYIRMEIPLHIVPQPHLSAVCLQSLADMPRILSQEEEEAYVKTTQSPHLDLISQIHNGSVYTRSLCGIMEVMSSPLIQTMQSRLERNERRRAELVVEKQELLKQLQDADRARVSPSKVTAV